VKTPERETFVRGRAYISCIDRGYRMAKLVLIDVETGMRVRHVIRSMKQARRQQEWYETALGRRVRIEKVFERR
jgi:hypothetical protein